MSTKLGDFFTSELEFSKTDKKNKIYVINISFLFASLGLLYGIILNTFNEMPNLAYTEIVIICINIILFTILRIRPRLINLIATFLTVMYTFFFLYLIYIGEPSDLRHIWLFTYPLILLYFQDKKDGIYWIFIMLFLLNIAPLQPFIEIKYSSLDMIYISIVFVIITLITNFYLYKLSSVKKQILAQQDLLKDFNKSLEEQVKYKTVELKELNESLELKVQEKLQEIIKRDRILEAQSKQAVMGEMINMIAHQWRQPLSNITLQISQLQFKKMLGDSINDDKIYDVLNGISDTIIYLSDTIDDFLAYFHPGKDADEIELHQLLQKAVNLALPKAKEIGVEILINKDEDIELVTYINELVQVIVNLLNNAIDALGECNKEDLKVKLVTQIQSDNIIINIIDNANGISDENLIHLFEPYFSTKGKNGSGLGLYMSQMIIQKQLNGTLEVSSSKNGSIFTITIPNSIE